MIRLKHTKKFIKNFRKRIANNAKLQSQFQERSKLFLQDPQNPLLKNHKLSGARKYLNSFSVTGDIRVLYYEKEEVIYFVDIGTHNHVY